MQAIPTKHKGRIYRSRLEARWASFFDLMGWKYEYEPYDLKGWIPDFVIYGKDDILVEVKPFSKFEEFEKETTENIVRALGASDKFNKEVLLLGSTIFRCDSFDSEGVFNDKGPSLGWLLEANNCCGGWGQAVFNYYGYVWGFFHQEMSYEDRITGKHEGDHFLFIPQYETVEEMWNEAGNNVQWKAPQY